MTLGLQSRLAILTALPEMMSRCDRKCLETKCDFLLYVHAEHRKSKIGQYALTPCVCFVAVAGRLCTSP
jgi:hypothetical protein